MKKLFKTFALIALTATATTTSVFANDNEEKTASNFEVGMYSLTGSSKVRLLLEKEKGTSLVVTLKNAKGETLFRELVGKKSKGYSKYFNLSNLESGSYIFAVDNGVETIVKEITKKTIVENQILIK